MLKTKNKYLLILFFIIFIGILEINLGMALNNGTVIAAPINVNTSAVSPNENAVNTKFQEIKDIPYNEQSMNCKNKSELFADYLGNVGGKNIHLVTIQHDSGNYSHEFVEWNGHFYDACNNKELSYTVSEPDYLNELHKIGFTGLVVQSPYVHQ